MILITEIYPYTSSSSTIAAYATIGAGIPKRKPERVVGVMKAYSTCVGEGPFAAEKAAGEEASLVLRPEAVVLSEKGLLEGTVTLSTFMGSYQYYQVMVGDMEIQITDYNPVNRRIYEVGEKAYLDFDPHGVYIL